MDHVHLTEAIQETAWDQVAPEDQVAQDLMDQVLEGRVALLEDPTWRHGGGP